MTKQYDKHLVHKTIEKIGKQNFDYHAKFWDKDNCLDLFIKNLNSIDKKIKMHNDNIYFFKNKNETLVQIERNEIVRLENLKNAFKDCLK